MDSRSVTVVVSFKLQFYFLNLRAQFFRNRDGRKDELLSSFDFDSAPTHPGIRLGYLTYDDDTVLSAPSEATLEIRSGPLHNSLLEVGLTVTFPLHIAFNTVFIPTIYLQEWVGDIHVKLRFQSSITRRVFIATDEPSVFEDARNRYPQYVIEGDPGRARSADVGSRTQSDSITGIALDIIMLSRTDYLVCTFSSQQRIEMIADRDNRVINTAEIRDGSLEVRMTYNGIRYTTELIHGV
ncbi:uncharacterized protein DEA37_0011511 [Paragonimus westermani]|uniref:GT23 domain-containing protein n=1 Tax=Paragonimus westermani TaxID=34504 RepID=A0A5J4NLG2_9TREM|nr:uncharacterized protein DEA37_0011511 [Paragonimus westermani]